MKTNWILLLLLGLFLLGVGDASQNSSVGLSQSQEGPKPEHAKLYKFETGKNLPKMAAQAGPGEKIVVEVTVIPGRVALGNRIYPAYPSPILVMEAGYADAVVVGVTREFASGLTQDEDFVFTDWQTEVQEVLKNNTSKPLQAGDVITVTRPEGAVVLNGHQVEARYVTFSPFRVGGRYVLFLRYITESGSYQASARGSFELDADRVTKLATEGSPFKVRPNQTIADFLTEVRAAVAVATN